MNINDTTTPQQPHLCIGNFIGVAYLINNCYKKILNFATVINYQQSIILIINIGNNYTKN